MSAESDALAMKIAIGYVKQLGVSFHESGAAIDEWFNLLRPFAEAFLAKTAAKDKAISKLSKQIKKIQKQQEQQEQQERERQHQVSPFSPVYLSTNGHGSHSKGHV